MKSSIILIIIFGSCCSVFSQFTTNPPNQSNNFTFQQGLFNNVLYREFTSLVNAGNNGSLGNFVSVDTDDKTIKAGAILSQPAADGTAKCNVLSINLKGGNSKGILPILSKGAAANKFGAEITLNHLFGDATLDYSLDSINKYTKEWNMVQTTYDKINQSNSQVRFKARMDYKVEQIDSTIAINTAKIAALNVRIAAATAGSIDFDRLTASRDKYELSNLKLAAERTVYQDSSTNAAMYASFKRNLADNIRITKQNNIKWPANIYYVRWVSLTGGFDGNAFDYINPDSALATGIEKKNYLSPSFRIAYNIFRGSAISGIRFFSLAIEAKATDNFSSLSASKFRSVREEGTQTLLTEKDVFTGEYTKDLWQGNLRLDYYRFIRNKSKLGYHFFPEVRVRETEETSFNLGVGVVVTFKNKEKEKSIINAEFFANALDLSNENESKDNISKRTELGVRVDFPITFKQY